MLTLCYSILDPILYVDVSLRQNLSLQDIKMSRLIGIVAILYLPQILVYFSSMSVNCMQMGFKVDIKGCVSPHLQILADNIILQVCVQERMLQKQISHLKIALMLYEI